MIGINSSDIPREHQRQIQKVINYIFRNLDDDLSLSSLAEIGNYSPYYFQKLFKKLLGQSPKQYINKLRLETAAYHLVIDTHKSIKEVSIECGFSSPAVFARSFKNYFGVSAEVMRSMTPRERSSIRKNPYSYEMLVKNKRNLNQSKLKLEINVKKLPMLSGICINTTFEGPNHIQQSLQEVIKRASSYDLISPDSKVIGIMYPHNNIYRAFVTIDPQKSVPRQLDTIEIKSGKYAAFRLNTCSQDAVDAASLFFYYIWLPENGYRMNESFVLELFSENPSIKSYLEIDREIYIPVQPI